MSTDILDTLRDLRRALSRAAAAHFEETGVGSKQVAVLRELRRVGTASQVELSRAMKQARALFAYGSESITNQGFWMGFAEMFDSYDWFLTYLDNLARITPEEVQRVARTYLHPRNRVLGVYLPSGDGEESL